MLTKKQNFLETIRGGSPDRFVNQFDFIADPYADPYMASNTTSGYGQLCVRDKWGVYWSWPEGTPGSFPVQDPAHKVLADVTEWEKVVKAPSLDFTDAQWQRAADAYAAMDCNELLTGMTVFPGLFEQTHCLMGIDDTLMAMYEEPEALKDLINYIVEWEMRYIRQVGQNLHLEMVFHHDDWGSSSRLFMSPDMFAEFFLEPYKRLYRCFRENGFDVIIHHNDAFSEPLVPYMIEMGIDVWQGATLANDLRGILDKYGDRISIMAGIDSKDVDKAGWTEDEVAKAVRYACETFGKKGFIPCQTSGGAGSIYAGVYDAISRNIDLMSGEMF